MGSEWRTVTIEEIAEKVAMGPFGSSIKVETFVPEGVPIISGQHLRGVRLEDNDYNFVSSEHAERLKNAMVNRGDVIFTHAGNIGQAAVIPESSRYDRYIISQRQFYLRCNRQLVEPEFVAYYFRSPEGQHRLLANRSQTGVPSIARPVTYLRSVEFPLPSLPEQRAIAHVLGALDDKIELNRRMNETLEEMARAVFKSWFVDFDPVIDNALRSGNPIPPELQERADKRLPMIGKPPSKSFQRLEKSARNFPTIGKNAEKVSNDWKTMPADLPTIGKLFPDCFQESELGWIPEGWEVGTVGAMTANFDSRRIPISGRERSKRKGPYPYYGAASVMDHIDSFIFDGIYCLVGEDGSVVRNDGRAVTQYVWGKLWVNNHAHVLQGKDFVSTEYVYLFWHFNPVEAYVTGAVQPKLSQGRMNSIPCVLPPRDVHVEFAHVVQSMFRTIRSNVEESHTLAALRDTLLPKLLSGEVRIKDAEKMVEEAT